MESGALVTKSRIERSHAPQHHPLVMAFARWACRVYLRFIGVVRVEIDAEDIQRLQALRGQRVVLTPNHPSFDPVIMFELSRKLNLQFCYLTARELFDPPLQAFVISRVGAYAVRRGTQDDSALHTSRQLLRDGKHWLVLFPEGEAHYLHDAVLPFLPGAARIGLGAVSDLAQAGGAIPPLFILPVALRYHYVADMRQAMLASLLRLEHALGLAPWQGATDWHARLGRIADHVLAINESAFGVIPVDDHDLQARLDFLRELVLQRTAGALGITVPPADQPLRNRLRKIFIAARKIGHSPPNSGGEYAAKLYHRRRKHTALLRKELERVLSFLTMTGTYSYDVPTVENYLDVLGRLELEVTGRLRFWRPRAVSVRVGNPIDLRQFQGQFATEPDATSVAVMRMAESQVRALLDESRALMQSLAH